MSETDESEDLTDVRERKLEELRARAEGEENDETTQNETTGSPGEPIHLDPGEDFEAVLAEHGTVLVDFYADWCGPCKMLEPVVEDLAANTDATVLKVDVDAHQQLAAQHGVRGVPTLLVVADGAVEERLVGMQEESRLRSVLEQYGA